MSKEAPISPTKNDTTSVVVKEKEDLTATATWSELFENADAQDYLYMAGGLIGGAVTGCTFPVFNVLFGQMLDNLNGSSGDLSKGVRQICIYFVILACGNLVSGFLQVYCWSVVGERMTQKFRMKYVNAILSQEIGWFDTCGASELSTRVAELIGKIQDGTGRKIGDLMQYIFQLIGSYVVAFYLSWKLTVVLIAAFPLIAGAGAFMITAITMAQNQSVGQYAKAGGLATEALGAIRTVTALNMQPDVINRYRLFLFKAMNVGIQKGFNVGIGNGGLFCACFLTYSLGFWYGGQLVADSVADGCSPTDSSGGCVTGGTILSVFFCTIMGSMALGQMAPPLTSFFSAKAAVYTILQTINRKPLIDGFSKEGLKPDNKEIKGSIVIKDLQFAYPSRPNIQVCRGYSLDIKQGESVALVGASGCGKSTIINLLLRFYDPQSGTISLDGYDISTLNIRWLRSQIGYVGQEPILFSGTVGDNISYGLDPELLGNTQESAASAHKLSPEQLKERIVAAAKLANAHDFISSFPQGYATDVGSNGVAMSGGQKQRIAIARALIKRPAVLLLDEATSALDAESERVVQSSIDELQKRKAQTTVIIAHRLSTIRNADKICVISEGKIAEMGSHDVLLAKNGLYADLVRLQMSGHDDEGEGHGSPEADSPIVKAEEQVEENPNESLLEREARKARRGSKDEGAGIPPPPGASPGSGQDSKRKRSVSDVIASAVGLGGSTQSNEGTNKSTNTTKKEGGEVVKKEPELSKEESSKVYYRIWGMFGNYWGWMIVACGGAIIFGGIFPSWGLMLAYSQNMFFLTDPGEIRRRARLYAFLYIMLGGTALLSATAQFWGVAQAAERVSINLRSQMFESFLRREIAFYDKEENNIGNLTTRLADDSRIVNKAFGESLARQLQAFFTLVVAIILGFRASWKVSLVVIAAFPVNIIASAIQMQAMHGQAYEKEGDDSVQGALNVHNKGKDKADGNKTPGKPAPAGGKEGQQVVAPGKSAGGVVSGGHGAIISTAFTHMRTVSAFSMQHKVSEHYAQLTNTIAVDRANRSIIAGIGFGGSQTSLFLTYALLFWYGSTLIEKGEINFLQLMSAILTLMLGALGLGTALADVGDQKLGVETAARIFKGIDEGAQSPIDGLSVTGITPTEKSLGRIEIKDVNFRYPTRPNVQVCNKFSLDIKPGQMIALVGPSGSGKSTIVNLLLRFYDPDSGNIYLDGQEIRSLNVRWLRSQMGFVGQEPTLFQGSVGENIAKGRSDKVDEPLMTLAEAMKESDARGGDDDEVGYCFCGSQRKIAEKMHLCYSCQFLALCAAGSGAGVHDIGVAHAAHTPGEDGNSAAHSKHVAVKQTDVAVADDREGGDIEIGMYAGGQRKEKEAVPSDVVEACVASNAHDFISAFPQGYDTDIGEGSIMVSGGQKQRIAIARALIKKPSILLLDEATSALDATSERVVQESLDALHSMKAHTTIVIAHRLSTIRAADKIIVIDKGLVVEQGNHDELLAKAGLYATLWAKQQGAPAPSPVKNGGKR